MYVSINNIIYLFGAILSILVLFASRSNTPSFFSRKRIIQLLRSENKDLNNVLKKLRKWYYYKYVFFTLIPIVVIFSVLSIFSVIQFTAYINDIIITGVEATFVVFYMIITRKLHTLYQKKIDEVMDSLRRIVDFTKMAETTFVSALMMDIIIGVGNILSNQSISDALTQITVLSVIGIYVIAFILFLSAVQIRSIESNYMLNLKIEGKMPLLSVKIRLKGQYKPIKGDILLLDSSYIVIQEADGYRYSLEYNKVEVIGAMTKEN